MPATAMLLLLFASCKFPTLLYLSYKYTNKLQSFLILRNEADLSSDCAISCLYCKCIKSFASVSVLHMTSYSCALSLEVYCAKTNGTQLKSSICYNELPPSSWRTLLACPTRSKSWLSHSGWAKFMFAGWSVPELSLPLHSDFQLVASILCFGCCLYWYLHPQHLLLSGFSRLLIPALEHLSCIFHIANGNSSLFKICFTKISPS